MSHSSLLLEDISIREMNEILFQEKAVSQYQQALKSGEQVFLFYGPSGVGKTTLAKLHAYQHVYNPENDNLGDALIVNCSSQGTIDETRNLIQLMNQVPVFDKRKLFILDEAQQLTAKSQEAFMNILESLPKSTDVIFCSMNAHKLIPALRSRAFNIAFQPFGSHELKKLLESGHFKDQDEEYLFQCLQQCAGNFRFFLKLIKHTDLEIIKQDEDHQILRMAMRTYSVFLHHVAPDSIQSLNDAIADKFEAIYQNVLELSIQVLAAHEGWANDKDITSIAKKVKEATNIKQARCIHRALLDYRHQVSIPYPNQYFSFALFIRSEIRNHAPEAFN